jgi:hypothetical protein
MEYLDQINEYQFLMKYSSNQDVNCLVHEQPTPGLYFESIESRVHIYNFSNTYFQLFLSSTSRIPK